MKILKWLGILLAAILVIAVIGGLIMHEKLPESKQGPEAEALADKMMQAVNCAAWDSIGAVSWTFVGVNEHLWDKHAHRVRVRWGGNMEALVDINSQTGLAFKGGVALAGDAAREAVDKGWKLWVNDSFWLNAPCKARDGGTTRSLVNLENGKEGLLISYHSGGATPGDKYLWELADSGMPELFRMWVSIIPIGGLAFTNESWEEHQGAKLAALHIGAFSIKIDDIKTAQTAADLNGGIDPFEALNN